MGQDRVKTSGKRIETIDVLRGFALAGILYAHMVFWYTGAALPAEEYFKYNSTADTVAMAVFGALVFGKFFSVFSFLFGLSFYLHFKKNNSNASYFKVYVWRMFLLFLIGVFHHLFWRGDILAIYAVLGVLLLFFRRLPDKLLLTLSLIFITNLPLHLYEAFASPDSGTEVDFPMAEEAGNYYWLIKTGTFATVLQENWSSWPAKIQYQLESGRFLMTFGYFLLGFYAGRKKIFSNLKNNISRFLKWNKTTERAVLILLSIGLLMYLLDYVTLPQLYIVPQLKWLASFLFSIYNACLTIFYITGITLLFHLKLFREILKPLAEMGKMALTNYLLQTVFGLLIFYQVGFGLFDITSPSQNVLLSVVVFYLQLKLSIFWLRHFKQGPVEWLWKGFTYFKFTSIKKKQKTVSEASVLQ